MQTVFAFSFFRPPESSKGVIDELIIKLLYVQNVENVNKKLGDL
jgi:hypothetical protein